MRARATWMRARRRRGDHREHRAAKGPIHDAHGRCGGERVDVIKLRLAIRRKKFRPRLFPGTEDWKSGRLVSARLPGETSREFSLSTLTNAADVPRQCRPCKSSTGSRHTPVSPSASRFSVHPVRVARFDQTMPAFVTPRREPESTGRPSLVNVSADATHPGETPDPGEAWPLPKRLRVRLQTSAERFGKETDLDERLALAERLQVRASVAVRASRVSRGFVFSPEKQAFRRSRAGAREGP